MVLNRNEDLYARYFDWKRHYDVALPANDGWCDICKMANDANQPIKVYPDIHQWWMVSVFFIVVGLLEADLKKKTIN